MYTRKTRLKNLKNIKEYLPIIIIFPIVLIIWECIDYLVGIKEIVLPNPHEILFAITDNFNQLMHHTYITSLEAVLGFFVGTGFSICIAIVFIYSKPVKKTIYPYIIIIQAIPMLVLAPLLILWFGNGMLSKIVMAALVCFFPVLVNSVKGFTAVEPEIIDLFKSYSATKWQIFQKLRLPNASSYIFPALKMAITFAVIGAVISEFTGASAGIGHLIVSASYYLDTSLMFASIVMISLVGIVLFYLFDWLEKRVVFWETHE